MFRILILIVIFVFETNGDFPKFFTKCNRKDANFHDCCKKAASDGLAYLTKPVPEYNLISVHPLEIPVFRISSNSKEIISTDLNFTNCKIYGLTEIVFQKFEYDFVNKKFELEGSSPKWEQKCQYNIKGTILGVPIDSSGLSTLTLIGYKAHLKFDWKEYQIGKKIHWRFENPELIKEPENFSLIFEGENAVNKVIEENSKKFYEGIGSSHEAFIAKLIESGVNAFFAILPVAELFD